MNPSNRWDTVLEALAAEPRRQIIAALLEVPDGKWLSLPAAATSTHTLPSETLRIHLRHNHLPKLANPGYIRWENEPFRVTHGPNFDVVGDVVELSIQNAKNYPEELVSGYELFEARV